MHKKHTPEEILAWTARRGGSDIHAYAALSKPELVKMLLKAQPQLITEGDLEDTPPLHYACAVGSIEMVKLLIMHGADINAQNMHGETPLLWSIIDSDELNRHHKISYLLEQGAAPSLANVEGETILHQAFRDPMLVTYLIKHGAQVDAKNLYDWTPLHYSVLFDDCIASTEILIDNNANVNAPDDEGLTPLHIATQHHNPETIALLIASGSNIHAVNHLGLRPYDIAKRVDADQDILDLLQ